MCELLGMSFNQLIGPNLSFRGFRHRGEDNPHGWGLAFYPDNKAAQIFKEPIKSSKSLLSEFVKDYPEIKSKSFIAHVRYAKASAGAESHKNTHPFNRELCGKEYVFAHNGTLCDYRNILLGKFKPIGETDSEYAFCYILQSIEKRQTECWGDEDFIGLANKMKEINDYGTFNCLLSDGEHLLS